jgi:hypothetical protein
VTRFAKAAILLMFIGLLLLPALQMATGWLPTDPLNENRRLAPWPSASALHRPSRTLGQLSLWFQDHYGLRDILVRTKTQIDFSVFGVSDRVYFGSDGWLFYRSVIDVEHPQLARLSDADLDRIITRFSQLRDTLAARGIKLIVVTNEL